MSSGDSARAAAHAERAGQARPAAQTSRHARPANGMVATVARLQSAAGNAAVAHLLRSTGRTSPATVQRYEAGEHSQFGGQGKVMVNGVELSEGEVIAMGDFFDTPEAMQSATADELTKLRDLIRRDQRAYKGEPGATPVGNDEWDKATGGRYMNLAAKNVAHFAPAAGSSGLVGVNHKAKWYELSKQALHQAWFDGRTNGQKVSNEAQTINSFAAHFLTDAFAAGHLINKPSIIAAARDKWTKMAEAGLVFKETAFTMAAARGIVMDPVASKELRKYELKLISWGEVTPERFSEFMYQVAKREPDKFFNAFARTVHDELDEEVKTGAGVEVTNERGDKWLLAGDATLSKSPDSLRIASAAVAESNANLAIAARAMSEPNYAELQAKVWAYTPKPTTGGQKMIDDVVQRLADPNNADAVSAVVKLTIEQLPTAINELVTMGYMRRK